MFPIDQEFLGEDTIPQRDIAARAAAMVGIPTEVLERLRGATPARELSAREWLKAALELDARVSAAA